MVKLKAMSRIWLGVLAVWMMSCTPAEKPVNLTWNFSAPIDYEFIQIADGETYFSQTSLPSKTLISGAGVLEIDSSQGTTTQIKMYDFMVQRSIFDTLGNVIDTLSQTSPPLTLEGFYADGTFENSPPDILFDLLLRMPLKELIVGESTSLKLSSNTSFGQDTFLIEGYNTYTLTRIREENGEKIAVIKGIIDISSEGQPLPVGVSYQSSKKGQAVYRYNMEKGYFSSVNATIVNDFTYSKTDSLRGPFEIHSVTTIDYIISKK